MWLSRLLVVLIVVGLCSPAEAQQAKNIPRIGYLVTGYRSDILARTDAFRQGLREWQAVLLAGELSSLFASS